jgi:hypothetical protein
VAALAPVEAPQQQAASPNPRCCHRAHMQGARAGRGRLGTHCRFSALLRCCGGPGSQAEQLRSRCVPRPVQAAAATTGMVGAVDSNRSWECRRGSVTHRLVHRSQGQGQRHSLRPRKPGQGTGARAGPQGSEARAGPRPREPGQGTGARAGPKGTGARAGPQGTGARAGPQGTGASRCQRTEARAGPQAPGARTGHRSLDLDSLRASR